MSYEYDYLVYIGRFQPFHNGHAHVIKEAMRMARRVFVLIGSSNAARRPMNPFTFMERMRMIRHAFPEYAERLYCLPLQDHTYNEPAWLQEVQKTVIDNVVKNEGGGGDGIIKALRQKVGIIGHMKDETSYYIKSFPQWGCVEVGEHNVMNATDVRDSYLTSYFRIPTLDYVPNSTRQFLTKFIDTPEFKWLVNYNENCQDYKCSMYGTPAHPKTPWPMAIPCADAVMTQTGNIALVLRDRHPGEGLWALPGGHVNRGEMARAAAIRELKEETQVADKMGEIPPGKLGSFIAKSEYFDHPKRSERGWVVTNAFHFDLPTQPKLYTIKGADDAREAKWFPLGELKRDMFFEDHAHIIMKMLGISF